jgi:hypothetical protein
MNPFTGGQAAPMPMITTNQTAPRALLATVLLGALAAQLHAWEPNARELDDAIQRGDFTGYLNNATVWLNQSRPTRPP